MGGKGEEWVGKVRSGWERGGVGGKGEEWVGKVRSGWER